jgi:hypothetical protein
LFILSRHARKHPLRIEEETTMPVVMFRPAARRSLGPLALACLIVSLCIAPLPNVSGWLPGGEAGTWNARQAEAEELRAIRVGFLRARLTENEARSGSSTVEHDAAMSDISAALATMPGDVEAYRSLRTSLEHYLAAFRSMAALPGRTGSGSTASIEAVLGQLQVRDEADLRDKLLRFRLSEAALSATDDADSAQQVSLSADEFSGRLGSTAIPDGTRARLAISLAVYEHDASIANDAALAVRQGEATLRNAAHEVEVAMREAGRALMTMPAGQMAAADAVFQCGWWMFGVVLAAMLSLTAGAGFRKGRASVFDRRPVQRWALR